MSSLQQNGESGATGKKKRRSRAEREGKFHWVNRNIRAFRGDLKALDEKVDANFELLFGLLRPFLDQVGSDFVVGVVCVDEADRALLDYMRSKGDVGISPSEASAAVELRKYSFQPYHVTRRVQRMNARLKKKLGEPVAEVYHRRWVLTGFVMDAFGRSREDLEEESSEEDDF